jgi:hypothetical protein
MPDDLQAGHRFFTPEAVERIIDAADGFPAPSESDPRDTAARRQELAAALEFAADRFFDTVVPALCRPAPPRGRGRPPVLGLQALIESLLSIFMDVFDGNFRSSYDWVKGETRGRNVRFLSACLSELRKTFATRRVIPVYKGRTRPRGTERLTEILQITDHAIRHRIQDSDWRTVIADLDSRLIEEDSD